MSVNDFCDLIHSVRSQPFAGCKITLVQETTLVHIRVEVSLSKSLNPFALFYDADL